MAKKIMWVIIVLVVLCMAAFIGLVVSITLDQYEDTRDWQDTRLAGEIKDIPPFLAKNYVQSSDKDAVHAWNIISEYLDQVDTNGTIPKENWESYEEALAQSVQYQELYGIVTGEIQEKNQRLQLYLNIEKALETVYDSPQTEVLQNLTDQLSALSISMQAPANTVYFEKLIEVATDYENLALFLTDTLPKLGVIENGSLNVNTNITKKETEDIKQSIRENGLERFPFVKQLYDLLYSNDYQNVLISNKSFQEWQAWRDAREALYAVRKSDYYQVSSIKTYQQALDAAALDPAINVWVQEQTGYEVEKESTVLSITYEGMPLSLDQYIRHGTPITVDINEQYKPVVIGIEPDGWDPTWGGDLNSSETTPEQGTIENDPSTETNSNANDNPNTENNGNTTENPITGNNGNSEGNSHNGDNTQLGDNPNQGSGNNQIKPSEETKPQENRQ